MCVDHLLVMSNHKDMKCSRRRFINMASIGLVSSAIHHKLFSSNAVRKNDRLFESGDYPLSCLRSSSVEIDGKTYGAQPDERGAIGGGNGYTGIFTRGDYVVENIDALKDALSKAKAGEVVFIPTGCSIDLTTFVYIDKFTLKIPEGVTLASDRGYQGREGAMILSDTLNTRSVIRTEGSNVRVTGLRIKGPNPKRYMEHHRRSFGKDGLGHEYYYKFPVSNGILTEHDGLTVDNCEISAFSHAAIRLIKGDKHSIHHNYIHHCQYNGLGYGISHSVASSSIEYNLFDHNRHSIAGTGVSGCGYVAKNNIECGESLSHCFDMHGGRDRKDGTNIAGTLIVICNNTFKASQKAVVIRGEPEEQCRVYHNWFLQHHDPKGAVSGYERTHVFDNLYGDNQKKIE